MVTGGGYGIGRASSLILAADGWSVLVADIDTERARGTAEQIEAAGGTSSWLAGDVCDRAFAEAAIATAARELAPFGGLVTCAAARCTGAITETSHEDWDRTLRIVLGGVFNFCHAAVPALIAEKGGSIVNVSSPDCYGRKGMVAYASAKAAVNTLSLCLAADHLADRIRVNVVLPGFTLSGMTEHYSAERLALAADRNVAGRISRPDDVARQIRFLMSDDAETITGAIMGGRPLPSR